MSQMGKKIVRAGLLSVFIYMLLFNIAYGLPHFVDLRGYLPPVEDQGIQESSAGWAVAYYVMGFYEKKIYGNAILFSPSFVYNQLSAGIPDKGAHIEDALKIVHYQGCAKLEDMPYDEHDCSTLPTAEQYTAAMHYRVDGYESLFQKTPQEQLDDSVVNALKSALADGSLFIVKLPVFNSFRFPTHGSWTYKDGKPYLYNPVSVGSSFASVTLCVCGYDDDVGGFLVRSSWGVNWAYNGDAYISYDFFKRYTLEGWRVTAFSNHTIDGYITFSITCDHRTDFDLWVGNESGWEKKVFGYLDVVDDRPNIEMAVDITEGIRNNPSANRYYLRIQDRLSDQLIGTVETLQLFENTEHSDAENLPQDCPDGGNLKVYVNRNGANSQLSLVPSVSSGNVPLSVSFSISGNFDETEVREYQWDFDGDGSVDETSHSPSAIHVYHTPGEYSPTVRLLYTDGSFDDITSEGTVNVFSANTGRHKPGRPIVNSPHAVKVSRTYTITSSAFSSNYGGRHVLSRWLIVSSKGKIFDRIVNNTSYLTSLPLSLLALDNGSYRVKVAYCDESGNWSDWSEYMSFKFVDNGAKGKRLKDSHIKTIFNDRPISFSIIGGKVEKFYFTTNEIENLLVLRIIPQNKFSELEFESNEGTSFSFVDPFTSVEKGEISRLSDGEDTDIDGLRNGYIVAIFSVSSKNKTYLPSAGGCSAVRYSNANGIDLLLVIFSGAIPLLLKRLKKRN